MIPEPDTVPEKKTILVVEDEAIIAIATAKTVKNFGYQVMVAETGEKAVELAIADEKVCLILMDIDLGSGIDGSETAKRILEKRELPIVFLTSHMEREYVNRVRSIPHYGCVLKNTGNFILEISIDSALQLFDANKKKMEKEQIQNILDRSQIEMELRLKSENLEAANEQLRAMNEELIISNSKLVKFNRDLIEVEESLQKSEQKAGMFLDISAEIIISLDSYGKIVLLNESGHRLLGYKTPELIGKNWFDSCLPEENKIEVGDYFENLRNGGFGIDTTHENTVVRKDGEKRVILWHNSILKDNNGVFTGTLSSGEDITERELGEKKLRESARYSRNLLESSLDPLVTINAAGKITDVNAATEKVTGVLRDQLIGKDFCDYFTQPEKAQEGYQEVFLRGYVKDYPLAIRNQNGQITEVLYNASLYQNEEGTIAGIFAAARDITDRKCAEEKVQNLLKEKELLLREVHHRIKNNMNTIRSVLILQADTVSDDSAIAALQDAVNRVTSMMVLYDKLYRSPNFQEMSVKEYLPTLIEEIASNFPNRSVVTLACFIEDFILRADTLSPLGMMINELLTNAMKHAFTGRDRGRITISVTKTGKFVTLTVEDDGVGISSDVLCLATDLSRTERTTGFGLELVEMLSRQLKGTIRLECTEGTRFILEFEV